MADGAIVSLVLGALGIVGAIVGASWSLANRIGGVATSVAELGAQLASNGERLERIEADATARAHTLSGVRDRLASLEGQLDPAPFTRRRGQS